MTGQPPFNLDFLNDPQTLCVLQAKRCAVALDFLNGSVRRAVQSSVEADPSKEPVQVFLLRVLGWLRTIAKLSEVADFQAMASAARFMFEASIDLTLLVHDQDASIERMTAWVDSFKYKINSTFMNEIAIPEEDHQWRQDAIDSTKSRVEAARAKFWNGLHPNHWMAGDWASAARRADKVKPAGRYIEFLRYYRTRYAEVCAHIHSGVMGVSGMPTVFFPRSAAIALRDIENHALLCAELVMRYFGKWDDVTELDFAEYERRALVAIGELAKAIAGRPQPATPPS